MTAPQDPFGPPGEQTPGPAGQQPTGQPQAGGQYGQQPSGSPPPGYGQQYGQPAGTGPKRNGLGIAALVVGLVALVASLSVVGGIVLGLVAIVLGVLGRGRVKRGEADNGGVALAGLVLGAVAVVLSIVFVVAGVALFQSSGGQELIDCVEQAAGDPAAKQACEREFAENLGQ